MGVPWGMGSFLKKINKKKCLYTICFIGLALIDWIRGSQKGVYWAAAVNLIGVVMAVLTLSQYSWKDQSWKRYVIWFILWIPGGIIGYGIWNHNQGNIYCGQYITGAVAVGCLGLSILRIWQKRQHIKREISHMSVLAVIWVIMSVCMVLSRNEDIWQGWFLLMFAMFYITPICCDQRKELWDGLANGLIIAFFIVQIYAYVFRPYDEVRYKGAYANCNMNALFYLVTYIMVLYRIHDLHWQEKHAAEVGKSKKNKVLKIFYYVMAGGLISFTIFTISRTALLVVMGITVIFGIVSVIIVHREKIKKLIGIWLVIGLCAMITFPCVYLTIRYLPTIFHHPVWWEGEYSVDKVHSYDPPNSWKYVSMDEFLEEAADRIIYKGFTNSPKEVSQQESEILQTVALSDSEVAPSVEIVAETDFVPTMENIPSQGPIETPENIMDLDSIDALAENPIGANSEECLLVGEDARNSGKIRMQIYKLYWKNLNFTGHRLTEGYFQITEYYHAWHAQNIFLQAAFYYGIPAGICFVILIVGMGIQAMRQVFKRRESTDILPLLSWLLFVGFGMLESVWYPGQIVLFLMFITGKIVLERNN